MIKLMKRCLIQIKIFFIYNFSFFAFINWCVTRDSKSRNILYKYHPFFIGENDIQAVKSLILIRGKTVVKDINIDKFKFNLYKDYYFLFKGLCVPFMRFFNYELNYLHKVTKVSYTSKLSKIMLVVIWVIGLTITFLIILSSSNWDLKSIDYRNWPIVHFDSNFTSSYENENDKKAAEFFQKNLMGNVQCFFDILITSVFTASNIALTNEILNKPGYTGIYISIGLGFFDIYILSSLILKSKFNYNGANCLLFLFDTWKNFDKIINSIIRITALTNKKIFLDDEKKKNIRDNKPDDSFKLRFIYHIFFWAFIIVWIIFSFMLAIQTFIFINCSILYDLIVNFFSSAIFINLSVSFGYIFLFPLTVLPFQYLTCSIVFFLLYLKDKLILSCKKQEKIKVKSNKNLTKINSTKNDKLEENLLPRSELQSEMIAESFKEVDTENKRASIIPPAVPDKPFIDLESVDSKLDVEDFEKSITDIESPKLDKDNASPCEDEAKDLEYIKPDSIFTMLSFPFILFALCCKLQYIYPLLISAENKKESAVKIAFGLPFFSLSYYSLLIESVPTKLDQALVKLRLILKFIDSLF